MVAAGRKPGTPCFGCLSDRRGHVEGRVRGVAGYRAGGAAKAAPPGRLGCSPPSGAGGSEEAEVPKVEALPDTGRGRGGPTPNQRLCPTSWSRPPMGLNHTRLELPPRCPWARREGMCFPVWLVAAQLHRVLGHVATHAGGHAAAVADAGTTRALRVVAASACDVRAVRARLLFRAQTTGRQFG
jgi:hypothetical protein